MMKILDKSISLIIEDILQDDGNKVKLKLSLYENKFQKWTCFISISFYILSIVCAVIFLKTKIELTQFFGLIFLTITLVGSYVMIFTTLFKGIKEMKNPLKTFLKGFEVVVQKELLLLNQLCTYKKSELEFFANRLKVEYDRRSQALALVCGAMNSMGLIPVTITTLLSISTFSERFSIDSHTVMFVGFILFACYFIGFFFLLFKLRLERYQFLVMHATSLSNDFEGRHNEKRGLMLMDV